MKFVRLVSILTLISCSYGCASFDEMHGYEVAWHTMNAIDAGQTIHIAREPSCYREVGFPTQALIGDHPSERDVYLTMAAYSLAFHYTNRWLDKKVASKEPGTQSQGNWVIARAVFNGVGLVTKFVTIMDNADIGLEPWGSGCY